jgi:hypothetical protein
MKRPLAMICFVVLAVSATLAQQNKIEISITQMSCH